MTPYNMYNGYTCVTFLEKELRKCKTMEFSQHKIDWKKYEVKNKGP